MLVFLCAHTHDQFTRKGIDLIVRKKYVLWTDFDLKVCKKACTAQHMQKIFSVEIYIDDWIEVFSFCGQLDT